MFGTLTRDLRERVPLKFIENRDLSSALSRNSRDRPHVSCEFCRSRKVRCSGQPSGCSRCEAVGVECRYPPREPRRKTATNGRGAGGTSSLEPSASNCSRSAGISEYEQRQQEQPDLASAQDQAGGQPDGSGESAALSSVTSPRVFDPEMAMRNEYLCQAATDHGFPMDLTSKSALQDSLSAKDGLDEWLDIDHVLETTLSSYSSGPDGVGLPGGGMADSTLMDEHARNLNVISNLDPALLSTSSSPGPQQPSDQQMMSGAAAPAAPATQSSSRSIRSGSNSNTTHVNTPAGRASVPPRTQPGFCAAGNVRAGDGACGCLQVAACLVEELGAKAAAGDCATMDTFLGDFRSALAQYGNILDCERCATARENNMLLAMAAKYMSTLCERVVVCYAELKRTQGRHYRPGSDNSPGDDVMMARGGSLGGLDNRSRSVSSSSTGGGTDGLADEIRFSTYRIESSMEKMQVLRALVTVQVAEFGQMLARLETRPGIRRGHLVLLTEAGGKLHALQFMLRGGLDDSLAMRDLY